MTDTILFELRVTERGIDVYESDAWRAYHAARRPHTSPRRAHQEPVPLRDALRQRLDALQTIYDDLYRSTADVS